MLQVHFQIGVNLSILIISSPLHLNFKNIQRSEERRVGKECA